MAGHKSHWLSRAQQVPVDGTEAKYIFAVLYPYAMGSEMHLRIVHCLSYEWDKLETSPADIDQARAYLPPLVFR
jgi:hypothetical protein